MQCSHCSVRIRVECHPAGGGQKAAGCSHYIPCPLSFFVSFCWENLSMIYWEQILAGMRICESIMKHTDKYMTIVHIWLWEGKKGKKTALFLGVVEQTPLTTQVFGLLKRIFTLCGSDSVQMSWKWHTWDKAAVLINTSQAHDPCRMLLLGSLHIFG